MYKRFFKRLFDIILALISLPFLTLVFFVISPCIYFQDKGPIFYNAPRLGKDGKIFRMYKFRSMKINAPDIRNKDGSTYNSEDDPRLTKIGNIIRRTSLDETPQILNIIKGEMSIIGPRPDLPEMLNRYTKFERKKLLVRPGVTGYNQAFYRNSNDMQGKFLNDVYYVENLSLILDIKIFFRTIHTVIFRKNVYRDETFLESNNQRKETRSL